MRRRPVVVEATTYLQDLGNSLLRYVDHVGNSLLCLRPYEVVVYVRGHYVPLEVVLCELQPSLLGNDWKWLRVIKSPDETMKSPIALAISGYIVDPVLDSSIAFDDELNLDN